MTVTPCSVVYHAYELRQNFVILFESLVPVMWVWDYLPQGVLDLAWVGKGDIMPLN
jgi:hypothetical protein